MKKIYLISIFAVLYVFINFAVNSYLNDMKSDNLIQLYSNHQNDVLDTIETELGGLTEEKLHDSDIMENIFIYNNMDGFLYIDGKVVYEKDKDTTMLYKDSTARELLGDSYMSDDKTKANYATIMLEKAGSEVLTKISDGSKDLISWRTTTIGESQYITGVATDVEYILKQGQYAKFKYISDSIFTANNIIVLLLCFLLARSENKHIKKD